MFALPSYLYPLLVALNMVASAALVIVCGCRLDHATPDTMPFRIALVFIVLGVAGFLSIWAPLIGWQVGLLQPIMILTFVYFLVVDRRQRLSTDSAPSWLRWLFPHRL